MSQQFYIRHAVGSRLLFEAGKHGDYQMTLKGSGWEFRIKPIDQEVVSRLIENKHELNLFTAEQKENQPLKKTWYYSKDGDVNWDGQEVIIYADSMIEYLPE